MPPKFRIFLLSGGSLSKRFGRNQKRKLKAELEELQKQNEKITYQLSNAQSVIRTYESIDKEFVNLLGPNTAFRLTTPEIMVRELNNDHRIYRYNPISVFSTPNMDISTQVEILNLRRMLVMVAADPDQYRDLIRLRISDDKATAAMYYSTEYLDIGLQERDIQFIAEDIARKLVQHINKGE